MVRNMSPTPISVEARRISLNFVFFFYRSRFLVHRHPHRCAIPFLERCNSFWFKNSARRHDQMFRRCRKDQTISNSRRVIVLRRSTSVQRNADNTAPAPHDLLRRTRQRFLPPCTVIFPRQVSSAIKTRRSEPPSSIPATIQIRFTLEQKPPLPKITCSAPVSRAAHPPLSGFRRPRDLHSVIGLRAPAKLFQPICCSRPCASSIQINHMQPRIFLKLSSNPKHIGDRQSRRRQHQLHRCPSCIDARNQHGNRTSIFLPPKILSTS